MAALPTCRASFPISRGAALSPESLKKLARARRRQTTQAPAGVRLGACVGGVGKFIAIGLNYADHAAETGAKIPSGAHRVHEGHELHRRPQRHRAASRAARSRWTGKSSSASSSAASRAT